MQIVIITIIMIILILLIIIINKNNIIIIITNTTILIVFMVIIMIVIAILIIMFIIIVEIHEHNRGMCIMIPDIHRTLHFCYSFWWDLRTEKGGGGRRWFTRAHRNPRTTPGASVPARAYKKRILELKKH